MLAWARDAGLVGVGFSVNVIQRAVLVDDGRRLRDAIDEVGAAVAGGAEPPAARTFAAASLTGAPGR